MSHWRNARCMLRRFSLSKKQEWCLHYRHSIIKTTKCHGLQLSFTHCMQRIHRYSFRKSTIASCLPKGHRFAVQRLVRQHFYAISDILHSANLEYVITQTTAFRTMRSHQCSIFVQSPHCIFRNGNVIVHTVADFKMEIVQGAGPDGHRRLAASEERGWSITVRQIAHLIFSFILSITAILIQHRKHLL